MKILEQLQHELSDFEKFYSLRLRKEENDKLNTTREKGYLYNQLATLNVTDYYFRGEFTSSRFDDEGQRMIFINQIQFPVRVARKQVDIDVKDIAFVPDTLDDAKKIRWVKRQFHDWAKEEQLGQTINDLLDDYTKYGTCVYKRVGNRIERQPLHQLINTQETRSLKEAATNGGYVMVKHEMYPKEMHEYPDWNVDTDLDPHEKYTVYERYGLVGQDDLVEYGAKDEKDGDKKSFAMSVILERKEGEQDRVLFMEEMDEEDFPFGEAHWERDNNRWLGVGESENQFENQIAKNLTANLRRRALLWASKKVFQSSDKDKADLNLIKEVKDGTVLEVGRDGAMSQINTSTQHLGDFQSMDALIDQNSQQKSFTFESATGETLPSGTPFRLGVVLSQATNTHFNLKKETFALMLDRMFYNDVIPIFKAMPKSMKLKIAADEEGIDDLRDSMVEVRANQMLRKALLTTPLPQLLGTRFNKEEVKQRIRDKIAKEPYFFVNLEDDYYDNLGFAMSVEVTGQNVNVEQEVTTLTSILEMAMSNPQSLENKKIVDLITLITAKTGTSVKSVLGDVSQQSPEMAGIANQALTQELQGSNIRFNAGNNQGEAQAITG